MSGMRRSEELIGPSSRSGSAWAGCLQHRTVLQSDRAARCFGANAQGADDRIHREFVEAGGLMSYGGS